MFIPSPTMIMSALALILTAYGVAQLLITYANISVLSLPPFGWFITRFLDDGMLQLIVITLCGYIALCVLELWKSEQFGANDDTRTATRGNATKRGTE